MKAMAVIYVTDLARMQSFYRAAFDMTVVDDSTDYCVLESETLVLSLVMAPEQIAARVTLADPSARRENVPLKLGFGVDSIDSTRAVVARLGGAVDAAATSWDFHGMTHCDGVDPEGNVIQLVQPVE